MGEVFAGRYELLDLIGQGGMGSVWRVHDRRNDEVVAAKVLRQSDASSLLRFVRETAFRVQHPHVVTPLGWAGEDDRVLFTMPIVDGGSVSTLVGDHGPLPAPFVAEILRQLLDGLSAVHGSRIVHRDVKPANILLAATGDERPHVYLTDFGIAAELDGPRLTETNMAIGTRGYMAPEQWEGDLTTKSDLYAAGAVAGFMLTAVPPASVRARFNRPADVPEPLWRLVIDLLREDPEDRPDALTAIGRLQVPELAWAPGAVGDVEVLRQIDLGEGHEGDTVPRRRPVPSPAAQPPAPALTTPGAPDEPTPPPATTPMAGAPDVTSVDRGQPAQGEAGGEGGDPATSRKGRWLLPAGIVAVLLGVVAALVIVWSPWSGSGEEAPDGPTVAEDVGDSCEFSEVGLRGATEGGDLVVCTRDEDGTYTWEPEDS